MVQEAQEATRGEVTDEGEPKGGEGAEEEEAGRTEVARNGVGRSTRLCTNPDHLFDVANQHLR